MSENIEIEAINVEEESEAKEEFFDDLEALIKRKNLETFKFDDLDEVFEYVKKETDGERDIDLDDMQKDLENLPLILQLKEIPEKVLSKLEELNQEGELSSDVILNLIEGYLEFYVTNTVQRVANEYFVKDISDILNSETSDEKENLEDEVKGLMQNVQDLETLKFYNGMLLSLLGLYTATKAHMKYAEDTE